MNLSSRESTPVEGGTAHKLHPSMEVGHVWLIGPGGVAEGGDFDIAVATAGGDDAGDATGAELQASSAEVGAEPEPEPEPEQEPEPVEVEEC